MAILFPGNEFIQATQARQADHLAFCAGSPNVVEVSDDLSGVMSVWLLLKYAKTQDRRIMVMPDKYGNGLLGGRSRRSDRWH